MNIDLPERELRLLERQVDEQVIQLTAAVTGDVRLRSLTKDQEFEVPSAPEQQALIVRETGRSFPEFWSDFLAIAKKDLCLPGGVMFQQWEKWRDIKTRDVLKSVLATLAVMRVAANVIAMVAVAVCVFIIHAVTKIGIQTLCMDCGGT